MNENDLGYDVHDAVFKPKDVYAVGKHQSSHVQQRKHTPSPFVAGRSKKMVQRSSAVTESVTHTALMNIFGTKIVASRISSAEDATLSSTTTLHNPPSGFSVWGSLPLQQWDDKRGRDGVATKLQFLLAGGSLEAAHELVAHDSDLAQHKNTDNIVRAASPHNAVTRRFVLQLSLRRRLRAPATILYAEYPECASAALTSSATVAPNKDVQYIHPLVLPPDQGSDTLPHSTGFGAPDLNSEINVLAPSEQGAALTELLEDLERQHQLYGHLIQQRHSHQHHTQHDNLHQLRQRISQDKQLSQQQHVVKVPELSNISSQKGWRVAQQQQLHELDDYRQQQLLQQQEPLRTEHALWNTDLLNQKNSHPPHRGGQRVDLVSTKPTSLLSDETDQEQALDSTPRLGGGLPPVSNFVDLRNSPQQHADPPYRSSYSKVPREPRSSPPLASVPRASRACPGNVWRVLRARPFQTQPLRASCSVVNRACELRLHTSPYSDTVARGVPAPPKNQTEGSFKNDGNSPRKWLLFRQRDLQHSSPLIFSFPGASTEAGTCERAEDYIEHDVEPSYQSRRRGNARPAAPALSEAIPETAPGKASAQHGSGWEGDYPPLESLVIEIDLTRYGEDPTYDYVAHVGQQMCRGLFYGLYHGNRRLDSEESNQTKLLRDVPFPSTERKAALNVGSDVTRVDHQGREPGRACRLSRLQRSLFGGFTRKWGTGKPKPPQPSNGACALHHYFTSIEQSLHTCCPNPSPALWAQEAITPTLELLVSHEKQCSGKAAAGRSFDLSVHPAGCMYKAFSALINCVGGGLPADRNEIARATAGQKDWRTNRGKYSAPEVSSLLPWNARDGLQFLGKKGQRITSRDIEGGVQKVLPKGDDVAVAAVSVGKALATSFNSSSGTTLRLTGLKAEADASGSNKEASYNKTAASHTREHGVEAAVERTKKPSLAARIVATQQAGFARGSAEHIGGQGRVRLFEGPKLLLHIFARILRSPLTAFLWSVLQSVSQEVRLQQTKGRTINLGTALTAALVADKGLQYVELIHTASVLPLICSSYIRYNDVYAEGYGSPQLELAQWAEHPVMQFLLDNKEQAQLYIPANAPDRIEITFYKVVSGVEDKARISFYKLWHTLWFMVAELSRSGLLWTWSKNKKADEVLPWWSVVTLGVHRPILRLLRYVCKYISHQWFNGTLLDGLHACAGPVRYANGLWRFKNIDPKTCRLHCGKTGASSEGSASPAADEDAATFASYAAVSPAASKVPAPSSSSRAAGNNDSAKETEQITIAACNPFEVWPPPYRSRPARAQGRRVKRWKGGIRSLFLKLFSGIHQVHGHILTHPDDEPVIGICCNAGLVTRNSW